MTRTAVVRFRRLLPPIVLVPLAVVALVLLLVVIPRHAQAAEPPVSMGTAGNFSVLAGSTVTNTGETFMEQDLGVSPGTAVTGFPPGLVGGEIHEADAVAEQAKGDLTTAYNDAAGREPFTNLPAELGDTTLTQGVYRIGAAQLTGELTLDSEEDPDAVFIFQIDSTLTTASNSSVTFINGASPCNVYWQVGSSATLGTDTDFLGNILAEETITMNTGATLDGRALARTSAVNLDTNTITQPECAPPPVDPTPTDTESPTDGPTESPTDGPTESPTDGPTESPTDGTPTDGNGGGPGPSGTGGPVPPDSDDGSKSSGLPITGSGALPLLTAIGLAAIAIGALSVFYRRRIRRNLPLRNDQ